MKLIKHLNDVINTILVTFAMLGFVAWYFIQMVIETFTGIDMSRDLEYINEKHRVLDDHEFCYPQYKGWIFWHTYTDPNNGCKLRYLNKKDAVNFILHKLYGDENDTKSK